MASLRAKIQKLRCQVAGEAKAFVPHEELYELLTRSVIYNAVRECAITPWYNLDQLVDKIHAGARRVFAILVILNGQEKEILHFIEHDHFQASPLDHKLPFSKADLEVIVPSIAIDFYEKQWEFSAPIFSREADHRFLDIFTALPFLENKKISEGGFGEVFSVVLHPGHQNISLISPTKGTVLARKQFPEIVGDTDVSYEQEVYNLRLLNQLKHPNILELLTFYTYQRRRHFLFPLAGDGDLGDLFKKECRPTQFNKDFVFYRALSCLSSAIEKVHDYTTDRNVDLKLIGFHHDLKPSNILVDNDNFILADFGLSRLKSSSQSSKTPFKAGGGDYLAPECEDLDDNFKKGVFGRSSDIWSYGCIIAEVLTYMLRGSRGIVDFRKKREFQVAGWKMYTFHAAGAEVNKHVIQWLLEMECSCALSGRQLIGLVRSMLSMKQEYRPKAYEVTRRLRFIAINELLCPLGKQYNVMVATIKSIQARLEFERFKSWEYILGFINDEHEPVDAAASFNLDFEQSTKLLQDTHTELLFVLARYDAAVHPIFLELRRLNDNLMNLLPEHLQKRALSYLELRILSEENSGNCDDAESIGHFAPSGSRVGMLAFIKRMSALADEQLGDLALESARQGRPDLSVEPETVEIGIPFQDHHLAWIPDDSGTKRKVLIEWIRYDMHWDGPVEKEMVARVKNIATFLNRATANAQSLRVLHCSGYFHSIIRHSFGLVYKLPDQTLEDPKTLNTIILETQGSLDPPYLGDRFALASTLASTVLDLHKAAFFHKSISSYNVVFFPNPASTLHNPYLIGFNHSRPNYPKAFTSGPPQSLNARRYQHPAYTTEAMRRGEHFRLEFDYYSLGIVLLEIGLWDTLAEVSKRLKVTSAQGLREKLLERRVPMLGHCVGSAYRDAVIMCLRGGFGGVEEVPSGSAVLLDFERAVVEPLRRLLA